MPIRTRRLEIIPADPAVVRAAMEGPEALGSALDAGLSGGWPPEFLDAAALEFTLRKLSAGPEQAGWWMHIVVLLPPAEGQGRRLLVGSGGYCGPPDDAGTVEMGYTIVREHQGRGYATEAARGLVARAFDDPRVSRVIGETLPGLEASHRVMLACGMEPVGQGSEPGILRFAITRGAWESRGEGSS